MKKIVTLCAVTVIALSVFIWRAVAKPSVYGRFTNAARVEIAALVERPQEFLGKTLSVEGTIREQCKASGCFFSFRNGEKRLRVELQDIAVTAPLHEGKPARVEGQLISYGKEYQLYATAVEFK